MLRIPMSDSETTYWVRWPALDPAELPVLSNRPPLDHHGGLEPTDRSWKEALVRDSLNGSLELPGTTSELSSREVRSRIDRVTHRLYHLSRLLQTRFDNPNHGNLASPFLETLYILLTWRSRIEMAQDVLHSLVKEFSSPGEILRPSNFRRLKDIVSVAGFSKKRPRMIVTLIQRFMATFDGDPARAMQSWEDEDVIQFLTSIDGIGYKSALCVLAYSLERNRFPADAHVRRILRRTGVLDELYAPDESIGHRKFQVEVEKFVPPSIRRVLHACLVSLGREHCTAETPSCEVCPAGRVCDVAREREVLAAEGRPFCHVDLFCGAGGFSTGFVGAGFRTVFAADHDADAVRTFELNHPTVPRNAVRCVDLETNSSLSLLNSSDSSSGPGASEEIHVITAGIPCQGFSKAGYRARPNSEYSVEDDPRNQLFHVLLDWTDVMRPWYVVIENVPEMKNAGAGKTRILEMIRRGFSDLDYSTSWEILECSDFGIPQVRRRIIVIASRSDVDPVQVSDVDRYHADETDTLEAIGDLPPVEADSGRWYRSVSRDKVTGHVARYNNPDDLKIFDAIRPGEHYRDFVERRRDILEDRATNSDRAVYSTESFGDKYHKLEPHRPSRTIVAHLSRDGNGYIHPEQVRSITPREAARLQGFPDRFVFCGSRSSQFVQIGNAVPPLLARRIAQLIKSHLERPNRE